MTLSITLDKYLRLDNSLQILYSDGSSDDFFINGFTKALFVDFGNLPDDSESLTISVMVGSMSSLHCFWIQVGIESRSHPEPDSSDTIFSTSRTDSEEHAAKLLAASSVSSSGRSGGR